MAFLRTISRIQIVWITNGVWCFWPRGCHRGMLHASLAVSKILVPGSWFSTLSLWCDRFFHWGSVLPANRLLNFAPWSHSTCWPVLTVWWVFKTQRCQSWWFDPYSWLKWCLNGAIPWMNRFYAGCALKYAVLTSSKSKYDWKLKKTRLCEKKWFCLICDRVNCSPELFHLSPASLRVCCLSKLPALTGVCLSLFQTLVPARGLNNASHCP